MGFVYVADGGGCTDDSWSEVRDESALHLQSAVLPELALLLLTSSSFGAL